MVVHFYAVRVVDGDFARVGEDGDTGPLVMGATDARDYRVVALAVFGRFPAATHVFTAAPGFAGAVCWRRALLAAELDRAEVAS